MTKRFVYLAGGIAGLSDADAKDWRARLAEQLRGDYEILDPMARDYRGKEEGQHDRIVKDDLHDIMVASVVIVKADRPSWGTAMEAWFAKGCGKRVLVVGAGSNPSPWLRYCASAFVDTMEQAAELLLREARSTSGYRWGK